MTYTRRSARASRRRLPRFRPGVDRLEGRELMAVAGALDPSFGTNGGVLVPVNSGGLVLDKLNLVQVESDGSVVAAGPISPATLGAPYGFGVVEMNANGTLDTSFGNDGEAGEAIFALPAGMAPYSTRGNGGPTALLVSRTGQIFIVASLSVPATVSDPGPGVTGTLVAEFDANGSLDTSFGTDGSVVLAPTAAGATGLAITNAVLEGNGDLLLAGTSTVATTPTASTQAAAVQLLPTGAIDTTFGTNGLAGFSGLAAGDTTTTSYTTSTAGLALEPDGQAVILAGVITTSTTDPSHYALIRLNADGSQDTTLGQAGILATGNTTTVRDSSLLIEPNGDFLIGFIFGQNNADSASAGVAQLNPDGSQGKTFTAPAGVLPFYSIANIGLQSNGDIVLIGGLDADGPPAYPTIRLTPNLTLDPTFGTDGIANAPGLRPPADYLASDADLEFDSGAVGPDNQIILAGSNFSLGGATAKLASEIGFAELNTVATLGIPGDFTGSGSSSPAVYETGTGTFVIGNYIGEHDETVQLGTPGEGNSIPAPADYFGTGQDDLAVYLVNQGVLAIADPTGQTAGVELPIGTPGVGQTIPVAGDYFVNSFDQVGVYLAQSATWEILAPGPISFHFGQPGVGLTIPVPGNYFGTGFDDIAVYLPLTGTWSILGPNFNGITDVQFGIPGLGNTIPAPGDYDGSGHTELGIYIPSLGEYQYINKSGAVVTVPFGTAGQSIPAPGAYDGSGQTDVAVYIPSQDAFAYRPVGANDLDFPFPLGSTGQGPIVPVTRVVPAALTGGYEPGLAGAIEPAGSGGGSDALDFVMPLASDAKKSKAGGPAAD